jgi:hypothetical protein
MAIGKAPPNDRQTMVQTTIPSKRTVSSKIFGNFVAPKVCVSIDNNYLAAEKI